MTKSEEFYDILRQLAPHLPGCIRLDADGDIMALYKQAAHAVHTPEGVALLQYALQAECVARAWELELLMSYAGCRVALIPVPVTERWRGRTYGQADTPEHAVAQAILRRLEEDAEP